MEGNKEFKRESIKRMIDSITSERALDFIYHFVMRLIDKFGLCEE